MELLKLFLLCGAASACQCVGGEGYGQTCTSEDGHARWCYVADPKACPKPEKKQDVGGHHDDDDRNA